MPQPNKLFEWAKNAIPGVEIIEPPQNKIDIGWISQEKPPYQFFNWAFNLISQWIEYLAGEVVAVVPVGAIIGFADYDGAATIDPDVWAYLNGQTINDADSPLNGKTLADASGRYLVGLGSDGGGNIGAVAFSNTPVGNAGHTVNLQHSHIVDPHSHSINAHSHTVAAHSHSVSAHSHGPGTLKFVTGFGHNSTLSMYDVNGNFVGILSASSAISNAAGPLNVWTKGVTNGVTLYTDTGSGATASGGGGNTGNASPSTDAVGLNTNNFSPGTNNQLSTTQSIQPRSIPVRWITRYK